jgi:hypothetical protein
MTYDEAFLTRVGEVVDLCHDRTQVLLDVDDRQAPIHLLVTDQTMLNGLDEDHEPDGGYPDTARAVYSIDEAQALIGLLGEAIERAREAAGS